MKKALLFTGVLVAVLVSIGAGTFATLVWMGERKLARSVEVRVVPVPFVRDAASLKLGRYLYESRGCGECHGPDGHGLPFIGEPGGMRAKAPNISPGPGGVVGGYGEADWVRTLRHGVNPAGRALVAMPSEDYNRLNDRDFAALVAYVRSLPPVAGEPAQLRLPLVVKALYGAGLVKDAAEKIDHRAPPASAVAVAVSAEHGAYVAHACTGCHGASLKGGRIPGAPPTWPLAADLTPQPGGVMTRYDTPEKFVAMMRSGKRPDGSAVSEVMPFASLRNMNDTDLHALHSYLRNAP